MGLDGMTHGYCSLLVSDYLLTCSLVIVGWDSWNPAVPGTASQHGHLKTLWLWQLMPRVKADCDTSALWFLTIIPGLWLFSVFITGWIFSIWLNHNLRAFVLRKSSCKLALHLSICFCLDLAVLTNWHPQTQEFETDGLTFIGHFLWILSVNLVGHTYRTVPLQISPVHIDWLLRIVASNIKSPV